MLHSQTTTPLTHRQHRLNARQRKKLHLGEYAETVFTLTGRWTPAEAPASAPLSNEILNAFSAAGLAFWGALSDEDLDGVIRRSNGSGTTESDRETARQILSSIVPTATIEAGLLTDGWADADDTRTRGRRGAVCPACIAAVLKHAHDPQRMESSLLVMGGH